MDAEVRETLSRHGMSDEDIERMAEFEAQVRKRKPRVKVEQPTLFDF
jgi:hypothetical protein